MCDRGSLPGRVDSSDHLPSVSSTQLPIQWVPADRFPGERRPDREANLSAAPSVENNARSFNPSPISLQGLVLSEKENFAIYLKNSAKECKLCLAILQVWFNLGLSYYMNYISYIASDIRMTID
jgi:hypothetical protein